MPPPVLSYTAPLANGRGVWAAAFNPDPASGGSPTAIVNEVPMWALQFPEAPQQLLEQAVHDLRARLTPLGLIAAWKGHEDGAWAARPGERPRLVASPAHGQNAVGIFSDGRILVVEGPRHFAIYDPFGDRAPEAGTVPNPDGTSQGVQIGPDDLVHWVFSLRPGEGDELGQISVVKKGFTLTRPVKDGPWWAGQLSKEDAGVDGIGVYHEGRDTIWLAWAGETQIGPLIAALGDDDCLVAISLPGLFLRKADWRGVLERATPVITPPALTPIDRPVWIAPGEVSGDPSDGGSGYHQAPGNAEIIWRRADLSERADVDKPFIGTAEVLATVTDEPAIGGLVHLNDAQRADWPAIIAACRLQADRLAVPVYAYRDSGANIAADVDELLDLGVDRFLLQWYPDRDGTGNAARWAARCRRNADAVAHVLAGFVVATYTGGTAWPLAEVVRFVGLAWDDFRGRGALHIFATWPWTWANPGRGGPNEHDELRALVERVAALAAGSPPRPGTGGSWPSPTPTPAPDPPHFPEASLMSPVGRYFAKDPAGLYLCCRPGAPDTTAIERRPIPSGQPGHDPHWQPGGWEAIDIFEDGPDYVLRFAEAGKVLCITPEGRLEARADAGPWERLKCTVQPGGGLELAYRPGEAALTVLRLERAA